MATQNPITPTNGTGPDQEKSVWIPKNADEKARFKAELDRFEQQYGKILSTGTALFNKLKAGKNKSIVQNAKKNIFEFPVFVASSVPLTYATATTSLLEQMYASFVQMTLSQQPIVNAEDISDKSTSDPFRYLRSIDVNEFLEQYELEFQKDSLHNVIVNEQTGNSYEFKLTSYSNNDAEMILEAVESMNTDYYTHFFQEVSDDEADKIAAELAKEMQSEDDEDNKNSNGNSDLKEARENMIAADKHMKATTDFNEAMRGTPPKMLKEGDINKLNTMKPLMMEAHFGAYIADKKSKKIGQIEQTSMIIGVRSYCRLVNSEDLPDMAQYSDSKNVLMKRAKYRAGEMKYWRDFKFDIKGKKNDVYENLATPEKKWYKRLYQMAHMRDDAIAPLVAKRGVVGALNKIDKAANGMIPNCSLVISQADVDYIKAMTSKDGKTGINLLNPSTARKLCSDMFLICVVVIDPDRESVKMFIPDLNGDWEVQSIDAINRQVATMNAAGVKSNEIFKMIAH